MAYDRGGKVWVDGTTSGWVALEKDWEGDSLPQDLVSEAGLIGTDFELADPMTRADIAGYAKVDDHWLFFLSDLTVAFHRLHEVPIFLRGDFNNWEVLSEFKLSKISGGWGLALTLDSLRCFPEFDFKFFAEDGRWIEPHAHFPPSMRGDSLGKNGWFHPSRTGSDLFSFRLIKTQGDQGLSSWVEKKPLGDFGFSYIRGCSSFRLFAPRAEKVALVLFADQDKTESKKHLMEQHVDGSWSFSFSNDLSKSWYQYEITQRDRDGILYTKEILDPYALATVGRNGPGIALNRSSEKKGGGFSPPAMEDAVVVEAHLRDLLANAKFSVSGSDRLEFNGLSKWLQSDECYLKKLGANVVELQPCHEFDARQKEEYHWGYMPVNFFSPSSSYSKNSSDGSVIDEFSQLIDSFHDAGLSVVLDVVYNHVGIPPHLFHVDPELYFLTDEEGNFTNFSGCGNDLRCNSEPVKKLIIDSLTYWVEEFDVDGFRFDLGELLGIELLTEIEVELKRIKPGILLFAEPWSFRGRLPVEMNLTSYALWSDACREELLKFSKYQVGRDLVLELLHYGLDHQNKHPYQSVNYLESHDDFSLVDRFRDLAIWQDGDVVPKEIVSRVMLAMGLLMVSPGVPMISSGQDFLRHKKGIRNTYLMGEVNAIDYRLEDTYATESTFIRELIHYRLSQYGRRARQAGSKEWKLHNFASEEASVIAFAWESLDTGERSLITANCSTNAVDINLPDSWKNNFHLLTGYGSGDLISLVQPLSFSWFINSESGSPSRLH